MSKISQIRPIKIKKNKLISKQIDNSMKKKVQKSIIQKVFKITHPIQ